MHISDCSQASKMGAHEIFLLEQNNPKFRENRHIQTIYSKLWTLLSLPANCSKECCNTVLYYSQNNSQNFVGHKTYMVVRDMIVGVVYLNP